MIKLSARPMTNSKMAGFQSAPSSFGEELSPTVFVYNEPGINGKSETWQNGDGVGDHFNENANLLSIVQYLVDNDYPFKLDRSIDSLLDHDVLAEKLDVYPSFFFMTDMEYESDKQLQYSNPNNLDWLPELSKSVLRDYVYNGGTIVQTGTVKGFDVDFLNQIFDFRLVNIDNPSGSWTKNSKNVDSLISKNLLQVESLPILKNGNNNDGVESIDASNIQNGTFTPYYGTDEDSVFGVIEYGEGKIYYVGSDYRKSGYATDWGFGKHTTSIHTYEAYVQQVLPAILMQASKEAKENLPFPQNYKEEDDSFVVNDGKPLQEDSFEFGPGEDQLINRCSLEITGDGVIDLGPNRDLMETNMLISASFLDGGPDFDQLILTDDNDCADGETADDVTAQSMVIDNFESIEVTGGTWQLEGDHRKADVLISGGTMQVPLLKRRLAGLRAKRFKYQGGEMTVDLSDTDLSSNNLEGRWVVLQAKGLGRSLPSNLDDIVTVKFPDKGYTHSLEVSGSRLIVDVGSEFM